jgi:hypothetical protein
VDYSVHPLSSSQEYRQSLGTRLGSIGSLLEATFGDEAQDIEGCVTEGGDVYVVQTRPQE